MAPWFFKPTKPVCFFESQQTCGDDKINIEADYLLWVIAINCLGPKKQTFWPKINILEGNRCVLWIKWVTVRHKLSMISENKVFQKFNFEVIKNNFDNKCAHKLLIVI